MTATSATYPGTLSSVSSLPYDDVAWVNIANMGADDTSGATIVSATYDTNLWSYEARLTNFGFTIPVDATIDGIVVEINGGYNNGTSKPGHVQLTKDGSSGVGNDDTSGVDWTITWPSTSTQTFGGSTSLWGTTWTYSEINASTFGVLFANQATADDADVGIDYVRVTIYYTEVGGEATGFMTMNRIW